MLESMTLEKKFNKIREEIGKNIIFGVEDVRKIFPDKKHSTLYWDMSKLVEAGYILRIRNGVYKIGDAKNETSVLISFLAKKVIKLLIETGFDFYVSGIDIISRYLHHVPENYPVMVFVEKNAVEEIKDMLMKDNYVVTQSFSQKTSFNDLLIYGENTILLKVTESFMYSKEHYAITEKAFMDLFYEITRESFPLSLQELARVYQNITRNGAIDPKRLVKIAYSRSMQYDIRYIVENKYISNDAKKFVEMVSEV